MFLMNEETSNGSRARVEVLVGTPGSHIHIPVMEVKLNVTSCMGQVKTNIAALREGREREGGRRGKEGERKGGRGGEEREGGREREGGESEGGRKREMWTQDKQW